MLGGVGRLYFAVAHLQRVGGHFSICSSSLSVRNCAGISAAGCQSPAAAAVAGVAAGGGPVAMVKAIVVHELGGPEVSENADVHAVA